MLSILIFAPYMLMAPEPKCSLSLLMWSSWGMQVGHVAVRESQMVRMQLYSEDDISGGAQAAFFTNLLAKLLSTLRLQPPGHYMLTHGPGSDAITCLKATFSDGREVCSLLILYCMTWTVCS